jgi:predicted deacylase
VLSSLGVLPAPVTPVPQSVELSGWVWLRSATGGWWAPSVSPGEHVGTGALVGTVRSLDGDRVEEVRSPAAGVPLFVTTSPAVDVQGLLMGVALE